jgi:hypothetical protein
MGSGLSYSVNSGRDRLIHCLRGDGLPLRHHLEFCTDWKNIKIFEGLSNSKNMVFNVKKLLNVGLSLTLRRKEPMRAEWAPDLADLRHRRPVFASEREKTDISQKFLRQQVVPRGQKTYPDRKYVLWQIQRRPTPPKSLSGHWRNSGFWRIGHHIRRTWIRWTLKPGTFCRQKPKLHLTQILTP